MMSGVTVSLLRLCFWCADAIRASMRWYILQCAHAVALRDGVWYACCWVLFRVWWCSPLMCGRYLVTVCGCGLGALLHSGSGGGVLLCGVAYAVG
jgi:hypothetical protein